MLGPYVRLEGTTQDALRPRRRGLEYKYFDRLATYHLAVNDDGSFYGWAFNLQNKQPQVVKGYVLGDEIEADTENMYCKNHLRLERE
jgi:hypothetical protein